MLSGNDVVDERLGTAALGVVEGVGKGVVVVVNQSP